MTLAEQFHETFGVDLKRFMSSSTGLDVIGLDNHLECPDGQSTRDTIVDQYGLNAYNLVWTILNLSPCMRVDTAAIFSDKTPTILPAPPNHGS